MRVSPLRVLILTAVLIAGAVVLSRASTLEPTPLRVSFTRFPQTLDGWSGRTLPDFAPDVLAQLRVNEYVNRMYKAPDGASVGVYIGYYATQRQGATMHSPLNCLPGSGWMPVSQQRRDLEVNEAGGARQIRVNRFVIEKGIDRQLVLYWYQSQGRVVASEYWGKIYTVTDALRTRRTDAAMIRVIAPIVGKAAADEARAEAQAVAFVQSMFPHLGRFLPA